jgi:hypothetical protein
LVLSLLLAVGAILICFAAWSQRAKTSITHNQGGISSTSDTSAVQSGASGTHGVPNGPLKVEYASPPPKIAPIIPDPTPVPAQAIVRRGDQDYVPQFHAGHSERIAAKLNQAIPIKVSWPGDVTHSDVFVQAVHGGTIDGQQNHKRFPLNDDKTISFTFTPNLGTGSYEVVLRRGTTEEALGFWVSTGNPTDPPTH